MTPRAFTSLEQAQLDWISRFADRLRLDEPRLAAENCGDDLNEVARSMWEQPDRRALGPEAAAEQWLEERLRR